MDKRPKLDNHISIKDFREFYWLKKELLAFCREEGLKKTRSKLEIATRIGHYITTGNKKMERRTFRSAPTSRFDWQSAELSPETRITDNYRNTENVRLFFEKKIGKHFKFNVKFMNWMKVNHGETLLTAIEVWKRMAVESKANTTPKAIAPQFEYNQYMRDFLVANPNMDREVGIKLWNMKKAMRGENTYHQADLKLIKEGE
ncbi:MAG: DUF6434 domain-containing protein [Cyclobacteriaceae bacterium]